METPLVNRVAKSGIITFNLEDYFPAREIVEIDIKEFLFQGLILREKEFRQALKEVDWTSYQDQIVCVYCSTDAIIPVWAYMLISSSLTDHAHRIYIGGPEDYVQYHYSLSLSNLDPSEYQNARIVIKGCSNKPVPASAYAQLTSILRQVAKSIMYGEPCSTVPIYKKPLKRIR